MISYLALIRGINVGGRKAVAMPTLRELFADLGYSDVATLLQSGNVIFSAAGSTAAQIEQMLETQAKQRLKFEVDFIVRSAAQWKTIVAKNPFPAEAASDPSHLVVMCLKKKPTAKDVATLSRSIPGREVISANARELYITYPDGIGTSKLTGSLIEKTLAVRGTARNWNTVLKIAAAFAKM